MNSVTQSVQTGRPLIFCELKHVFASCCVNIRWSSSDASGGTTTYYYYDEITLDRGRVSAGLADLVFGEQIQARTGLETAATTHRLLG